MMFLLCDLGFKKIAIIAAALMSFLWPHDFVPGWIWGRCPGGALFLLPVRRFRYSGIDNLFVSKALFVDQGLVFPIGLLP
jgi:hypothetical protein